MNARQIRDDAQDRLRRIVDSKLGNEDVESSLATINILMVAEVAAQLAELNEARKPRWVEFVGVNGHERNLIDVSLILGVSNLGRSNYTRLFMKGGGMVELQESYKVVIAKLGIEISV